MSFSQLLSILIARKKIIIGIFLGTVLLTALINFLVQKEYTASSKVVLNAKVVDPVTGMSLQGQMTDNYFATQLQVLQSDTVAMEVVQRLGLANNPSMVERFKSSENQGDINVWIARILSQKLSVLFTKSNVLEIAFTSTDPQFSALVANTFTDVYIETSIRLKTEPAQKAAQYLNRQVKDLRGDLNVAQRKLADFQKESGLTSNDDRVDVETARLNEMSAQLSMAQAQLIEANSRKHDVLKSADNSPDVAQSGVIQSLKMELSKAEANLASLSSNISQNHPQHIALSSQIDKLKRQIRDETSKISLNVSGTANITQERVTLLSRQVEQQKQKVLELNRVRGEMLSLQNDVVAAQSVLEETFKRFGQNNIEGESGQANIALLDKAVPPFSASKPRIFMNLFFGFFAGIFLGLLTALLLELLNRKVRTTQDLADLIDAPVFVISNGPQKTKMLARLTGNKKLLPSA